MYLKYCINNKAVALLLLHSGFKKGIQFLLKKCQKHTGTLQLEHYVEIPILYVAHNL